MAENWNLKIIFNLATPLHTLSLTLSVLLFLGLNKHY